MCVRFCRYVFDCVKVSCVCVCIYLCVSDPVYTILYVIALLVMSSEEGWDVTIITGIFIALHGSR